MGKKPAIIMMDSKGQAFEVDPRSAWCIEQLRKAVDSVIRGHTAGLTLAAVSSQGRTAGFSFSLDHSRLDELAVAVHGQMEMVNTAASQWQGNAPRASRSSSVH